MSTTAQTSPFRADIVGSFLRPAELKAAREKWANGQISHAELRAVEDGCIEDLIAKEKAAGLHCITDGEFRRSYWHLDFFWGFKGITHNVLSQGYLFHDEETRADSACLSGRVQYNEENPFFEHFAFLKEKAGNDVRVKQTIPAPAQLYAELVRGENARLIGQYYDSTEELLADIATAYRQTILKFYDLGLRTIQLDDCTWGCICDRQFWETMVGIGFDVNDLLRLYLKVNNEAIRDLPKDLTVTTHICRGNYHSTWAAQGGYEPVAPYVFAHEEVSAFYLEFDTERAGGFEPLKYIADGKKVVLGLITSKSAQLEDKAAIKARIAEAARIIPLDRLYLSPQCGFASTEEGNILTEDEQWQKVALVSEIAREVWG